MAREGAQRVDARLIVPAEQVRPVADRWVGIPLGIGVMPSELADEDDLAGGDPGRTALRLDRVGNRRVGGGAAGIDHRGAELLVELHPGEGVHRVGNGIAEPAGEHHIGGFAEERPLAGAFRRNLPVVGEIVAAEIGANPVIPYLIVLGPLRRPVGGRIVTVVGGIQHERPADLLEIAGAIDRLGPPTRLIQSGQQHRGENCDDRNHDQKFDQGELFHLHGMFPLVVAETGVDRIISSNWIHTACSLC